MPKTRTLPAQSLGLAWWRFARRPRPVLSPDFWRESRVRAMISADLAADPAICEPLVLESTQTWIDSGVTEPEIVHTKREQRYG